MITGNIKKYPEPSYYATPSKRMGPAWEHTWDDEEGLYITGSYSHVKPISIFEQLTTLWSLTQEKAVQAGFIPGVKVKSKRTANEGLLLDVILDPLTSYNDRNGAYEPLLVKMIPNGPNPFISSYGLDEVELVKQDTANDNQTNQNQQPSC